MSRSAGTIPAALLHPLPRAGQFLSGENLARGAGSGCAFERRPRLLWFIPATEYRGLSIDAILTEDTMRRSMRVAVALAAGLLASGCHDENSPTQPPVEAGMTRKAPAPGDPLPFLTPGQYQSFNSGMAVFATEFTPATGLGPLFNSTSCAQCHNDPVLGGYGDTSEVHVTAYSRYSGRHHHFGGGSSCNTLDAAGGPVVQQHATPALQAALGITKEPTPRGGNGTAIRTTPLIFGLGLIDAVSDWDIIALSRIRYNNGVHGRPAILPNGRVGRFGRKAAEASLDDFNAGAFFNEMGVTNPLHMVEGTVAGRPLPRGVDPAGSPSWTPHHFRPPAPS